MKEPYMKRGGFWMTTVATGLAVVGLMTVGRAALNSHGVLFLQGQMKIAAGDTDSGLKLLAAASSRPQMNASLIDPLERGAAVKAVEDQKACPKVSSVSKVGPSERVSLKMKPAPEPTFASLAVPSTPMPPMVQVRYMQDGMPYLPTAQREVVRAHELAAHVQRVREREMKDAMRQVSFHYGPNSLPNAEQIKMQVQRDLGSLAQ
jgi:hypothetical protein